MLATRSEDTCQLWGQCHLQVMMYEKMGYLYCVSHQVVGITVTLSALFVKALSGGGVSIKAHVLWGGAATKLANQGADEKLPMEKSPEPTAQDPPMQLCDPLQLNKHKQIDNRCIVCFYKLRDMERQERTTMCEVTFTVKFNQKRYQWCEKGRFYFTRGQMLPVSLLSLPPACRGWWSSSTGQWTKHENRPHPSDMTGTNVDLDEETWDSRSTLAVN